MDCSKAPANEGPIEFVVQSGFTQGSSAPSVDQNAPIVPVRALEWL